MPSHQHNLQGIIHQLTEKIAALEAVKDAIQKQIVRGHQLPQNSKAFDEVCESLEAAENAKTLLMDSCCTSQSCNFEYFD